MDRHSRGSVSSFTSLQQLDPSPFDSPYEEKEEIYGNVPTTRRPGLGGEGHGITYYLQRTQRYSSYAFSLFTTMHLTSTSLIPLLTRSIPSSEPSLLLFREYYQSPLTEPLLIYLPLTLHIASGLALRIHRRNTTLAQSGASSLSLSTRLSSRTRIWPRLSTISLSGYLLTPLLFSHVFVNRIIPLLHDGSSSSVGLGFVAHGFAKHPFLSWATYTALLGVGVGHMCWGWAKWLGWAPIGKNGAMGTHGVYGKRRWWFVNGIAAAMAALWAAGGLGVVARGGKSGGWVGKGYDELFAMVPFLRL